jgi:hypothetical protein
VYDSPMEDLIQAVNADQDKELQRLRQVVRRGDLLARALRLFLAREDAQEVLAPLHTSADCVSAISGRHILATEWALAGCAAGCRLCLLNRALYLYGKGGTGC